MWQAPKSRTDIWLRLPGWKERERGEVHEARKPYEAISLADSDRERERERARVLAQRSEQIRPN